MNKSCHNLYFLSTVACRLSECLSADEIAVLSADLMTLADMLASVSVRKSICENSDNQ